MIENLLKVLFVYLNEQFLRMLTIELLVVVGYLLAAGCLWENLFIRAITQPSLFVTGSAM